jgi:hypothetical protein
MKKITRFSIFESKLYEQESSDEFVTPFTQNASIALEQLFALLKVTPPASKGEDKTEANNAFDSDLRNKRILAYKELSGSSDLKSLMNLLITKANTVYSEIARNDAQRKAAVEKKAAEAAEKYSMPGMPYKPGKMPDVILDRSRVAVYFIRSLNILNDIVEDMEKNKLTDMQSKLLAGLKKFFSQAASQPVKESILIEENILDIFAKKVLAGTGRSSSYQEMFPNIGLVIDEYKSRLSGIVNTMNSIFYGSPESEELKAYSSVRDTASELLKWLESSDNLNLGSSDPVKKAEKLQKIYNKLGQMKAFLEKTQGPGGDYEKFLTAASKPENSGYGQYSTMLGGAAEQNRKGLEEIARLQSIITNMQKEISILKGFSPKDIENVIQDVDKIDTVPGERAKSLTQALIDKKSGKTVKAISSKLSGIDTSNIDNMYRSLSPITDYRSDIKKTEGSESTKTSKIILSKDGLPALRKYEIRFTTK